MRLLKSARLCFLLFYSFQVLAECSLLSGWADLSSVVQLETDIHTIIMANNEHRSASYERCQTAIAKIIIAYEDIKALARQEYPSYYAQKLNAHFNDNPLHSKFNFMAKYLMTGQVQATLDNFVEMTKSGNAGAAEVGRQLIQFISNKYQFINNDQKSAHPDGPHIIPLTKVNCPYPGRPYHLEKLVHEGTAIPRQRFCSVGGGFSGKYYPYQTQASSMGFELRGTTVLAHYCEQDNQSSIVETGFWIFSSSQKKINSKTTCYTFDLIQKSYLQSAKELFPVEPSGVYVEVDFHDGFTEHYTKKLGQNPDLPDKIKSRDEWWEERTANGYAPQFENFFKQHYPDDCAKNHPFLGPFASNSESVRSLDTSPAFWYYERAGIPPPHPFLFRH